LSLRLPLLICCFAAPLTIMAFLEGVRRSPFTFTLGTDEDVYNVKSSRLSLLTHLRSLSTIRCLAIVSSFIVGFTLTIIMKREHLLWLAASTAGASPLLQFGQGGTFDYPGLRFGADKKFSITVFSDLHFGERKLAADQTIRLRSLLTIPSVLDRSWQGS
jgi:hypothetical protein